MREIVLDTETTGINPLDGHRIVEIGAIELFNHIPSGRTFHHYLDPQRDMPAEAAAVHGLTGEFLRGKPVFAAIVEDLIAFIGEAPLVMHNASFDAAFLNAELSVAGKARLLPERLVDTLQIARQRHPMGPNSLDALCKRYGIDSSRRTKHGALLDAELLADVYIELIGGRQASLGLAAEVQRFQLGGSTGHPIRQRPSPLPLRLTEAELAAHLVLIEGLGAKSLWLE